MPEHFEGLYTSLGAEKICPESFMIQKSISLLFWLKYISVHLYFCILTPYKMVKNTLKLPHCM